MKLRLFSIALLCLSAACLAAPAKSAPAYAKVSSPKAFSGDRLFFVLDSLGAGGNWMEWDAGGVQDPAVANALASVGNKPEMVWVVMERKKPLLAALVKQGAGESILFYELPALDAKPVALKVNEVMDPEVVFRDYKQVSANEFVHRDQDNLRVMVSERRIRFAYVNPDKEPLKFDPDFSKKTIVEKHLLVREYMDFLKHEYSLMLRAFVQSTHGIFNWQPWHWYMPEWNSKSFISEKELEAILSSGVAPQFFVVFKTKTVGGEVVEFRANGNGFAELVISKL